MVPGYTQSESQALQAGYYKERTFVAEKHCWKGVCGHPLGGHEEETQGENKPRIQALKEGSTQRNLGEERLGRKKPREAAARSGTVQTWVAGYRNPV